MSKPAPGVLFHRLHNGNAACESGFIGHLVASLCIDGVRSEDGRILDKIVTETVRS